MPEEKLTEYVELLKRQNRWLKLLLLLILLMAVLSILLFIGNKDEDSPRLEGTKRLELEELILVDGEGNLRAEFVAEKGKTLLRFYTTEDGGQKVQQALLSVDEKGPLLRFYDQKGKPMFSFSLEKELPRIFLYDDTGLERIILAVMKKPGPLLILLDEKGDVICSIP